MGKMIRQQICFFSPTCRETQQDSSWRPAVTKEGFVPRPQLPPHGGFQKNPLALPRKRGIFTIIYLMHPQYMELFMVKTCENNDQTLDEMRLFPLWKAMVCRQSLKAFGHRRSKHHQTLFWEFAGMVMLKLGLTEVPECVLDLDGWGVGANI